MTRNIFINYTHPDELLTASNRRQIAQFIATHYRNRSAPSTRRSAIAQSQSRYRRLVSSSEDRQYEDLTASSDVIRDGFGLREDPFSVFPTRDANSAIDYYIHSYAPTHLIRPEIVALEDRQRLIVQHVKDAVQRPFMFESILALTFSNLAVMDSSAYTQRSALHHYGRAISSLRISLSQGNTEDAILHAIVSIIGVNYLQNNLSALEVNLGGLRQVVTLRGGLQAIGDLVQPAILTVESFWTYLRAQTHLAPSSLAPISFDTPSVELDLLLHRLPPGFRDLVREHRLSSNVARIIVQEAEFDISISHAPPAAHIHADGMRKFAHLTTSNGESVTVASHIQICEELARLLANPELTHLDLICCMGMFVNALCVMRSEQLSPIYFKQVQNYAAQLSECNLDSDTLSRDLHAWVMFQIASTVVPSSTVGLKHAQGDSRLELAIKVAIAYAGYTWNDMKTLLQKFICSDACLMVFENVWRIGHDHIGAGDGE